ncbi:MAG: type II secretion system protein [Candidatus Paceibacterota bacterium]
MPYFSQEQRSSSRILEASSDSQQSRRGFTTTSEEQDEHSYSFSPSTIGAKPASENKEAGFTLIELLVVIAIVGLLASLVLAMLNDVRDQARLAKSQQDLRSMRNALELYANNRGGYPPDESRDVPSDIKDYIDGGEWPVPAWEGSVFDWDNWDISSDKVYQLSIRFCESIDGVQVCKFPAASWADDFDWYSAVYLCIEGPCRSHSSKPADHPGHCLNCGAGI